MVTTALKDYVTTYLSQRSVPMHIFYLPVYFVNITREYDDPIPLTDRERVAIEKKTPMLIDNRKLLRSLGILSQSVCRPHEFQTKPRRYYLGPDYVERAGGYFEAAKELDPQQQEFLPLNHLRILGEECPGQNVFMTLYFIDYPEGKTKEPQAENWHFQAKTKKDQKITTNKQFYEQARKLFSKTPSIPGVREVRHRMITTTTKLTEPWLVSFVIWSKHQYVTPNEIQLEEKDEEDEYLYRFTLPTIQYRLLTGDGSVQKRKFDNQDRKTLCRKPSELIAICTSETTRVAFRDELRDFATFAIIDYFYSLLHIDQSLNENGYMLNVLALPYPLTGGREETVQHHPNTKAVQLYLKMGYRIVHIENDNPRGSSSEKNPFYMYRGPITIVEVDRWLRDLTLRPHEKDLYSYLVKYITSL